MRTHIVNEMADESEILFGKSLVTIEDFDLSSISSEIQVLKQSNSSKDWENFLRLVAAGLSSLSTHRATKHKDKRVCVRRLSAEMLRASLQLVWM